MKTELTDDVLKDIVLNNPILPGFTYTESKLRADFELFTDKSTSGVDITDVRVNLFKLFVDGTVKEENQAWEWLFARKWDEFFEYQRSLLRQYATDEGKAEFGRIWFTRT